MYKKSFQKHKEWLQRRSAVLPEEERNFKTTYLRKLIKFKTHQQPYENEVSFVPHLNENELTDQIEATNETMLETTGGNKFAYDTVGPNNEDNELSLVPAVDADKNLKAIDHRGIELEIDSSTTASEPQTAVVPQQTLKPRTTTENASDKEDSMKTHSKEIQMSSWPLNEKDDDGATDKISANGTSTNDYEIKRFLLERENYKKNNVTIRKSWSKWNAWTFCSRSCGEGVMSQSRECTKKV